MCEETRSLSRFVQSADNDLKLKALENQILSRKVKNHLSILALMLAWTQVLILALMLALTLGLTLQVHSRTQLRTQLVSSFTSQITNAKPASSKLELN